MMPITENGLISEIGINYKPLRDLLAAERWQEADAETMSILLAATQSEAIGYLRSANVAKLPTQDLNAINQLWAKYSFGKFGFSMQQRIWHNAGHNYTEFANCVGWHKVGNWLNYNDLCFSSNAIAGHLPALLFPVCLPNGERIASFAIGKWRVELLARKDLRQPHTLSSLA